MTDRPNQMPKLKLCPYILGQVWSNPDDEFMLVTEVSARDDDYKVHYVTENNQRGYFYSSNKAITDNITQVDTRAASVSCDKARDDRYDEGFDDGHSQGFEEGKQECAEFDKELRAVVFQFLIKRNQIEKGEEYTAQDIFDALVYFEKSLTATDQSETIKALVEAGKNALEFVDCDRHHSNREIAAYATRVCRELKEALALAEKGGV